MRLVLDASVAIAALRPSEIHHSAASARLVRLLSGQDVAVVPALFIVELRGALARIGVDQRAASRLAKALAGDPHEVVTLGPRAARAAAKIAARHKLRGSDACYVWLAGRESVPLCTLDAEMASRGKTICSILKP